MELWDKVKSEIDRAGQAAQSALDEGKERLEAFRARQRADKAAQDLGYAVFRARKTGGELDAETYARLSSELAAREADVARHEAEARDATDRRRSGTSSGGGGATGGSTAGA